MGLLFVGKFRTVKDALGCMMLHKHIIPLSNLYLFYISLEDMDYLIREKQDLHIGLAQHANVPTSASLRLRELCAHFRERMHK